MSDSQPVSGKTSRWRRLEIVIPLVAAVITAITTSITAILLSVFTEHWPSCLPKSEWRVEAVNSGQTKATSSSAHMWIVCETNEDTAVSVRLSFDETPYPPLYSGDCLRVSAKKVVFIGPKPDNARATGTLADCGPG